MRVAIIGAGPAGLAAAYDLLNAGHQVTILEGAPQVGGLAGGFKAPHWDWSLEKYYHHWFQSDASMLGLIKELGWSDQVMFPRPYTVIYDDGKFVPFDSMFSNMPAFLLRHFTPLEVFRFGLVGVYLRATSNWKELEKYSAQEWMKKHCPPRIYDMLWRPMLVGKFGEKNLPIVNMAWLWARLKSRTTRLGTFKGGFQTFMDKLADVVRGKGGDIRLGNTVTGIRRDDSGQLQVEAIDSACGFDAVISTSSPALMARLVPQLPAEYSDKLRSLKSMGAVVLVVSLDRQMTKYYWHNLPKEAGFPYLAFVEHTNFMDKEHYGGDHLVYCGDYLEVDHENFQMTKEQILDRFLPSFTRFNADFDRRWIKDSWLWKTTYAQPIPGINHSQNIPDVRTPLPGLYFASMSQVYPWDRGTNYAIEIGRRVAKMVMDDRKA